VRTVGTVCIKKLFLGAEVLHNVLKCSEKL
jgi:hypothetical protein